MRRMQATAALVSLVGGVLVLVAPASWAQTGYPPGSCTQVTGTQDVGTVEVGQQFVLQIAPTCAFDPAATVEIDANGVAFTDTAEANGRVLLTVNVLSTTQLSINPTVPARCGVNTVTARGPSTVAQGGTATQTATFTLNCPAGPAVATPIQARLSLTGANSVRFAAVALALVAAGSVFVVVARRRRVDA